jgi:hypothetical protein
MAGRGALPHKISAAINLINKLIDFVNTESDLRLSLSSFGDPVNDPEDTPMLDFNREDPTDEGFYEIPLVAEELAPLVTKKEAGSNFRD